MTQKGARQCEFSQQKILVSNAHILTVLLSKGKSLSNKLIINALLYIFRKVPKDLALGWADRVIVPNKGKGLLPALHRFLELGVLERGQDSLKLRAWCIAQSFQVVARE